MWHDKSKIVALLVVCVAVALVCWYSLDKKEKYISAPAEDDIEFIQPADAEYHDIDFIDRDDDLEMIDVGPGLIGSGRNYSEY